MFVGTTMGKTDDSGLNLDAFLFEQPGMPLTFPIALSRKQQEPSSITSIYASSSESQRTEYAHANARTLMRQTPIIPFLSLTVKMLPSRYAALYHISNDSHIMQTSTSPPFPVQNLNRPHQPKHYARFPGPGSSYSRCWVSSN